MSKKLHVAVMGCLGILDLSTFIYLRKDKSGWSRVFPGVFFTLFYFFYDSIISFPI